MNNTILTNIGRQKFLTATPENQIEIKKIILGDGGGAPVAVDPDMTWVVNEVESINTSLPIRYDDMPDTLVFEGVSPASKGGYTIREIGLVDADGDLVAIGSTPTIVKPAPENGGIEVLFRPYLKLDNASDVDLIIYDGDPKSHSKLINRDAPDSHPASAISYGEGTVADKLKEIVSGAVTEPIVDAKVLVHNHDPAAHPELRSSIISDVSANVAAEANRAEAAAEQAAAAGLVYESNVAGQADVNLAEGDYFFVVSDNSNEVLELWRKGASEPTDTGKRTVSTNAILTTIDMEFEQGFYSSQNGKKLSSTTLIRTKTTLPARVVTVNLAATQECRVILFDSDDSFVSATEFSDTHTFISVGGGRFAISLRNKDQSPLTPEESTAKISVDGFSAARNISSLEMSQVDKKFDVNSILGFSSPKNLMAPADYECRYLSAVMEYEGSNAELVTYKGVNAIKVTGVFSGISNQHDARLYWQFDASQFTTGKATAMVLGLAHGGDREFSLSIRQYDHSGSIISTASTPVYSGVSDEFSVASVTTEIDPTCSYLYLRLFIRGGLSTTPDFESYFTAPSIFDGEMDVFRSGEIVAEIDTHNLSEDAVDSFNCNFIDKPVNLFYGADWELGFSLDSLTGHPVESPAISVSDFIRVQPNTEYQYGPTGRVQQYDKNKRYLGLSVLNDSLFKTHARTCYVRVSTSSPNSFYMVENGVLYDNSLDEHESLTVPVKDEFAPFTRPSPNLFDESVMADGYSVNDDGDVIPDPIRKCNIKMLPIGEEKEIISEGLPPVIISFYRKNKIFISKESLNSANSVITPKGSAYYRVHTQSVNTVEGGVICYADEKNSAFPRQFGRIQDGLLKYQSIINKPYVYSPIFRDGLYSADGSLPFSTVVSLGSSTKVSDLYSAYDSLILDNSEYITKEILGKDESGVFDIWKLTLKPQYPPTITKLNPVPKIIINSGTHGHEWWSIWSTYLFVKDICDNWKTNPLLEWLRWNVEMVIIPSLNPWGLDQDPSVGGVIKRKNSNGIDINRQFPADFVAGTDPSSMYYAGIEPLSEAESQIADQFIRDNNDAILFIDSHNYGGSDPNDRMWLGCYGINFNPLESLVAKQAIQDLTINLTKNYGDSSGTWYSGRFVVNRTSGSRLYGHASAMYKLNSYILECGNTSTLLNQQDVVKVNVECLGGLIFNFLRASMFYGD